MEFRFTILVAAFFPLLAACSAPAPTPLPSPTLEPVTFSTATPIPTPTATAVRGTLPLATPSSIVGAMTKTKSAPRYRVTQMLNVKQGAASLFSLDLSGEANGDDEHYAYTFAGEQIEFVIAQGKYFVKGARSMGLPSATKWYSLSADNADAARPPFSEDDLLTSFIAQVPKENFQSTSRESLDGVSCQIYRYIPKNLNEAGIANLLGEPEASVFGALDASEIKLWICDDGLMHQLTLDASGHNPKRASDKGTAKLQLHLWDFANAGIRIDPPPNPEKFQTP
jgi:hypothetical protein